MPKILHPFLGLHDFYEAGLAGYVGHCPSTPSFTSSSEAKLP